MKSVLLEEDKDNDADVSSSSSENEDKQNEENDDQVDDDDDDIKKSSLNYKHDSMQISHGIEAIIMNSSRTPQSNQ